ncbi:MAG: hypothetical protein NVV62_10995 [Terricaulis sp.]|nr:hypothetical protein [Terricaulis sp.]
MEAWNQIGGPEPYHDSYTYSVFADEDLSARLVRFIRESDDADGWALAEEIEQAPPRARRRGLLRRFDELLRRVPARAPMPGDEIE